jgi:hypothetical protein
MNIGMVFAVIFTVILISFLLIFWSGGLTRFLCLSSDAQTHKVVSDIKRLSEELGYTSEGSAKRFQLGLPSETRFCFVNPENPSSNPSRGWDSDPVYEAIIKENRYNLWYYYCSGKNGVRIPNLRAKYNFCSGSGDVVFFENMGLYVEISLLG